MFYEVVTSLSNQQMILAQPNAFVKMYFLYNINKYKINLQIYLAYIYVHVSSVTWC
jgi:hypothetical protein